MSIFGLGAHNNCFPGSDPKTVSGPQKVGELIAFFEQERPETPAAQKQYQECAKYLRNLATENPQAYAQLGETLQTEKSSPYGLLTTYAEEICDKNPDNPHALKDTIAAIIREKERSLQIINAAMKFPLNTPKADDGGGSRPVSPAAVAAAPASTPPPTSPSTPSRPAAITHPPREVASAAPPPSGSAGGRVAYPPVSPPPTGGGRSMYHVGDPVASRPTTMPGATLTLFRGQQGADFQPSTRAIVAGFTHPIRAEPPLVAAFQDFFHRIGDAFSGGGRQISVGNDSTHELPGQMAVITRGNPVITVLDPTSGKPTVSGPAATLGAPDPAASDPRMNLLNNARSAQSTPSVGYNLGVGSS